MRRMILSSLVLLPVMAHAEAGLNLAAAPAVATAVNTAYRVGASNGRTLEYAMFGSVPPESTIPSVTRAVGIGLSPAEMAGQPAVFNVIVKATVDVYGVPHNLTISKSAGTLVDDKVLAAVSQYRFRPATLENQPVEAAVTISVKIQKP